MSKLLTLYTVATATPLEIEIGLVATFVTLYLSGLPGSHHCIPRGIPISTPRLRLNFSRGSTITSHRVCGWGPLTRASTCTLVPPGSADTELLRRKTQSSVLSSFLTAPSTAVKLSVSVWLGVGDSSPACWSEGGRLADAGAVSVPAIAASTAAYWRRRSSLRRAFRLALTMAAWFRRRSLIVQQILWRSSTTWSRESSLASARHLGMTRRGSSGFGSLSAVGRTAQKHVQAAVMSFDDVAVLVVCEKKGTQVDSGVGLNPSFYRKLMVLWCSFMKAVPRTTA